MKKRLKISKTSKKMIKVYCGLFIALSTIVAAFAWFEGTISKPGISVETGKIEVNANAYEYENNGLNKLGDATKGESLTLSIKKKEQKNLYIIVDRTVNSIEVDYFLNLTLESGKDVTLTATQKDELNRYLGGFTFSFYKLTNDISNPSITQKSYDDSSTYNDYEKKLDSYVSYCENPSNNHPVFPATTPTKSFAALSTTKEQDSLRDTTYANYYVFSYDYGSEIAELTDRVVDITLNLNYAQAGGLTEEDRNSDVIYCTTQNQFDIAVKTYMPGQTINVSCDVKYERDLVFKAPLNLVLSNATLTVTGNLIFSYPYFEKSTINTKTNGQIIVKAVEGSGGYLEVDVPNAEFEFIGKGAGNAKPDIYVQKDVDLNASYSGGVTLSGINIYGLTAAGAFPETNIFKDIYFEDNTTVTIGNNTSVGLISPYVSALAGTTVAPSRVAIIIYGKAAEINVFSMNYIDNSDHSQTVEQILIDSYGVIDRPVITLPNWAEKWEFIDGDTEKYYTGNTTIRQHFASTELDVNIAHDSMYSNQFTKDDIIVDQKDTYVLVNRKEAEKIVDITIYYQAHGSCNTLDLILKEFYYPSGYSSSQSTDYENKLKDLINVEIITGGSSQVSSTDQGIIRKMINVRSLDLGRAKYVNDEFGQRYFNGMLFLNDLTLPNTIKILRHYTFEGTRDLHEVTLPASMNSPEYACLNKCPKPFICHVQNTEKAMDLVNDHSAAGPYILVDPTVADLWRTKYSNTASNMRIISAEGSISEDWKYIYNDLGNNEYRIEKFMGQYDENEDITINEFQISAGQTGKIKEVAPMAYANAFKDVNNIIIGNNVKSIGTNAFRYSNANNLSITSGLNTIGDYAFANSAFNDVELSNINTIGQYAFNNSNLNDLLILNVNQINTCCFDHATMRNFNVSEITTINSYAFRYMSANSGIVSRIGTINNEVFRYTKIMSTFSAEDIDSLGSYVFADMVIDEFYISRIANFGEKKVNFQNITVNLLKFLDQTTISGSNAFASMKLVEVLDLEGVTSLPSSVFYASAINSIINTESLESLPQYCFQNVSKLRTFTAPNVKTCSSYTFSGCSVEVIDMRNAYSFPDACFNGCKNLTAIYTKCWTYAGYNDFGGSDNLKYLFMCGDYTEEGAKNANYSRVTGYTMNFKIIMPKGYYDAACIGCSTIRNKNFYFYEDGTNVDDILPIGNAKIKEDALYNYGEGLFYFNSDTVNEKPGVTLVCLQLNAINGESYTTPNSINYNSVEYAVTRLCNVYNTVLIDVDCFTIANNTKKLFEISSENKTNIKIDEFDGLSLNEIGSYCFYRGTYGEIKLNNVIKMGNYCFAGSANNDASLFYADKVNLSSLISSDSMYEFFYAHIGEINLSNLETISNGVWFHGASQFGDIDLSNLIYMTQCFDSQTANNGNSSFDSIDLSSLEHLSKGNFYTTTKQINEIKLDSLKTAELVFISITDGPNVLDFPSLESIDSGSNTGSCFVFGGISKLSAPKLTNFRGSMTFSNGLKEVYMPELVRITGTLNARPCQTLEILYTPKLIFWTIDNNKTCTSGVRDMYVFNYVLENSCNYWPSYFCNAKFENLYFCSDEPYANTVGLLKDRKAETKRVNVYVKDSIYRQIPASRLTGYGYNFINTGDVNPGDLYYQCIGSTSVDNRSLIYPEYQYIEEDGGITLVHCNKSSYTDSLMSIGGVVTIKKIINNVETDVEMQIKKLGDYLYSRTPITANTISINSSVTSIGAFAFGNETTKVCETLEMKNTGIVKTNAFAGLKINSSLAIHNNVTLEENSLPLVNGIKVKIFYADHYIPSTNAFGEGANSSVLSVSSSRLSDYISNAPWNGISSSSMSSFDSFFVETIGEAPNQVNITYYYKIVGDGIDIIYIECESQLDDISIPSSATIDVGGENVVKNIIMMESQALGGLQSVKTITLPSTLRTYIFNRADEPNTLTDYAISGYSAYFAVEDGVLFNANKTRLISYPKAKSGSSYVVPGSVTTISVGAFAGNINLESVEIATDDDLSITILGYAFKGCSALSELNITGKTILSDFALAESGLQTVKFNSVVSFSSFIFKDCNNLRTVTLEKKATFDSYSFANSNNGVVVDFKGTTVSEFIGEGIFDGLIIYTLKIPAGKILDYYNNVLFDQSIISHFEEKAS